MTEIVTEYPDWITFTSFDNYAKQLGLSAEDLYLCLLEETSPLDLEDYPDGLLDLLNSIVWRQTQFR